MSSFYPIYLDITQKICLVVGGGSVAERRVGGLLEAGAQVRLVSPQLSPGLAARQVAGEIEVFVQNYEERFLDGVALALACTDVRAVNAQVTLDARARGIPVNVADAPEEGSFIVPSVIRRGELCLSIATGGASPLLTARLSDELETRFGPEYGDFVELLGQMRNSIKVRASDPMLRRRAFAALIDAEAELRDLLRQDRHADATLLAQNLIARSLQG